jgi:hypothetical protein
MYGMHGTIIVVVRVILGRLVLLHLECPLLAPRVVAPAAVAAVAHVVAWSN